MAGPGTALERTFSRHGFYMAMGGAIVVIVFLGFAPTFYLRAEDKGPLNPLFLIHGLLFTAWFSLFLVQTVMIARRHVLTHRILGLMSIPLAIAMVPSGLHAGLDALDRGVSFLWYPPETFFFISFTDMIGFAVLYGAGLIFRRRAGVHKRLMLLATISISLPAAGRIANEFGIGPAGVISQLGLLAALALFDWRSLGRIHPASLAGIGLVLAKLLGIVTIAASPLWVNGVGQVRAMLP